MASNRITEGVGKKIVEALKNQSDIEIIPMQESSLSMGDEVYYEAPASDIEFIDEQVEENALENTFDTESQDEDSFSSISVPAPTPAPAFEKIAQPQINPMNNFSNSVASHNILASDLDGVEIPTNVAVLKQLITKLPSGVTKQTGAQIIKQTMEALGISMSGVLQEAQQVQEGFNNSAKECQATIVEYKKQINVLEKQAQKYQRQYAALNDIISLFVQTNY